MPDNFRLTRVSIDTLAAMDAAHPNASGLPTHVAFYADRIYIWPPPSGQEIPKLTNPRRWLVESDHLIERTFMLNEDIRVIREVKPITRDKIYKARRDFSPRSSSVEECVTLLRNLGIDVED